MKFTWKEIVLFASVFALALGMLVIRGAFIDTNNAISQLQHDVQEITDFNN